MIWDYTDDSMCTLLPLWKDMNLSTAKHNAKRERENILPSFTLRKNRLPWDKMTPSSYRYDCSSLLCRLTTVSYARISYQCECVLLHFFFSKILTVAGFQLWLPPTTASPYCKAVDKKTKKEKKTELNTGLKNKWYEARQLHK